MEYITVDNNIITGLYSVYANEKYDESGELISREIPDNLPINSTPLPIDHTIRVGEPLNFYNADFKRKSLSQLVQEKLFTIPPGYKIVNDELVYMNTVERILAGIDTVPKGMKIENDSLVPMSDEELFDVMTKEEKEEYHRNKRDTLFADTLWKVDRHTQEKSLGVATTLTEDEYLQLLQYIQKLRDIPQQPNFPDSVIYPTLNI